MSDPSVLVLHRVFAATLVLGTVIALWQFMLLAVVMLALFGRIERTYAIERAAHARAVAAAKGKRIGRPSMVDPGKLAYYYSRVCFGSCRRFERTLVLKPVNQEG